MAVLISVSLFTFVVVVSVVVATKSGTKYDVCGFGDADTTNGLLFLEVSESDSSSKLQCSRVIRINQPGRLQLNITDFRVAPQDSLEIFDGPNPNVRSLTTNIAMQPVIASGNAVLVRFQRASELKVASSHFLANFHAVPYPTKCSCRPVKNGVLECNDKYQERICRVKCNDGYYDVSLGDDITCDMHKEGKWSVDIHGRVLSCQMVSVPQIRLELRFNYLNSTCEEMRPNGTTRQLFEQFLANVTDVQKFGKCFANKPNCTSEKIAVKCGPRTISVNITDEVKDQDYFEKLYKAYGGLDFKEVIKKLQELNVAVNVTSFVKEPVAPLCQDTSQSFFKLLITGKRNFSNVCSSCPLHHFHNSRTGQCEVCQEGSTAPEGSSSCVNGSLPAVPIQHSCRTRCMLGQQYSQKPGFCEWCPVGQYQDSTELDSTCQQCPPSTTTVFGGTDDVSNCTVRCSPGTFYDTSNAICVKCPVNTYQDQENLFTRCKPCGDGKHTATTGSISKQQCQSCTPGRFFDEQAKACKECPKHSYQDQGGQDQCKNCTNGKMTLNPGAMDKSSCITPCKAGQLFNKQTGTCEKCPRGRFQDQDNHLETSCKPCGSGKTTEGSGAKKESDCILACDAGQFAEKGKQCLECPRGYFQDLPNQSSCKKCPDRKTTREEGQKNVTACVYLCPSGTFLDVKKNCSSCPFGTYQDATNHSLTKCIPCSSGETSGAGGATSAASCLMNCGLYPCRHGARCIPKKGGFSCDCGHGLQGKRCEVIENKNQLRTVEMSLEITSLDWVEQLGNRTSLQYSLTKGRIESEIRQIMEESAQYIAVEVNDLRKSSVDAFMTLYFGQNSDPVPARKLQAAAAQGAVGNLTVSSLRILHQTCRGALGMEAKYIKDDQITVNGGEGKGRLNGTGWRANNNHNNAYLQIGFQRRVNITAVASQGISSPQQCYVSSYKLAVSEDGKTWTELNGKIFVGNNNSYAVVRDSLAPVLARFIKFKPQDWNNEICMRVEVYGCLVDPTISAGVSSASPPGTVSTTAAAAPSDVHSSASRLPLSWGAYLGIACFVLFLGGAAIAICCWKRKSKTKKLDHTVEMETLLDPRNPGTAAGGYKYTRRRDNDNPEDQEVIELEENRV